MRRLSLILLLLAATLTGCRRDPSPIEKNDEEMGVFVTCPGTPATRADEGTVGADVEEYRLHSLQVWIFTSEDHELLYYLPLTSADELPAPGQTRRYAIPVGPDFARRHPLPDIDVFALANAASIGCTLNGQDDWETVNGALFGDDWFGVQTPVRSVDTEKGLPMTGARRNMTLSPTDDGLVLNADQTVELVRAVSKVRFVFCRMRDDDDPNGEKVSIENITLNGGQIPVSEYLFTASTPYAIGPGGYEADPVVIDGPAVIAPNAMPEKLVYAGQSASAYEKLLNDAIASGILTDGGEFFFRESDKALSGMIHFTTDGIQRTRIFSMDAPGDFARNHSWTLFGYFISGRKLELSINAIPWSFSHYHIDFSQGTLSAERLLMDETTANIRPNEDGHNDVFFLPGTSAKGSFTITSPVNGKVMINPIGNATAFIVTPMVADINPDINGGKIDITVRPNPDFQTGDEDYSITLSFYVETVDGRDIDANSEINRENYRFIR